MDNKELLNELSEINENYSMGFTTPDEHAHLSIGAIIKHCSHPCKPGQNYEYIPEKIQELVNQILKP